MIDGICSPAFDALKRAFAENFESGEDVGASVALVHRGELVADLWGGHVDAAKTVEWQRDSIVNVWSTTKTMTALCMLLLIDRGLVDPDAPVMTYWPEFEANGKRNVLIRHIMSHTAGLPGWPDPIDVSVLHDWDRACALLASQPTWWEPGAFSGYHGITQGFLCGEVVRRVTGYSLGTFFAREVGGPLGADFQIGTSQAHDHRIVPVIAPVRDFDLFDLVPESETIARRAMSNITVNGERGFAAGNSATIEWRRSEQPAANGHGNGRSIAIAQSAISHDGEVFGRRLLTKGATDVIFREQCNGMDRILFQELRHGIGWALPGAKLPLPSERACWWDGWGGALCVNDLEHNFTLGYAMNRMIEPLGVDPRRQRLLDAVYSSLAK